MSHVLIQLGTNVQQKLQVLFQNANNFSNQKYVVRKTLPILAGASYLIHSGKFLAPNLFSNAFGDSARSFSNALLLNSIFGDLLYIFSSKHMRHIRAEQALTYSAFCSVMFNFGSILFWMFTKQYLPENETMLLGYGVLSGFLFLRLGREYLHAIDTKW